MRESLFRFWMGRCPRELLATALILFAWSSADASVPGVETGPTNSISGLTQTSVNLMGGITNLGGTTVTNAGFFLNTNSTATNGVKYSAPGTSFGLGSFSNTITGLTPGTSYYYRAFAANSFGTGYGASEYSFTTPSPFTYTNNGTGLTITGYTGTGGNVVIPDKIGNVDVTAIGNDAFKNETLTAVTLPNSLRSIGEHAFENNGNLTAVTIPEGVTTIGSTAFAGCRKMELISLPSSLTTIGDRVFQSCDKLNNVIIPASVISLGENAFQQCISLTSITLPNGLSKIESSTFWFCENLTTITIPSSVNEIKINAFLSCSKLASVYFLGNTRPTIGLDAFKNITSLAKGYYPATASAPWSGITGLSLEPMLTFPETAFRGTFDGTSSTVRVIPLLARNDFSLAFWIKTEQAGMGLSGAEWWEGVGLLDGEVSGTTNDFGTSLMDGGKIGFGVGNLDLDTTLKSTKSVNNSIWHHVVVTRNNNSGGMNIYVDGVLDVSKITGPTGPRNAPSRLTLGSLQTNMRYFQGEMADIRIYDREISAADVWLLAKRLSVSGSAPVTALLIDADADGLDDSVETNTRIYVSANNTGTNPSNPDSDNDELSDGQEVNTYGTNPLRADTDFDGVNDKLEVQYGTSPTVSTVFNRLINGSFEEGPVLPSSEWLAVPQNDVLGWKTTAVNTTDPVNQFKIELWYKGFLGISGNDGNILAELNYFASETLYQDVTMTVNSPVSYSFLHRGRAGNDEMVFKIDELSGGPGTSVAKIKFTLPVTTGTSWRRYSGSQATSVEAGKTYRFSYTSVYPTDGSGNLLDDASFGIDQDGDGLLDYEELALGTDPLDFDSDGDDFWDGVEVTAGTNPKQTSSSPKPVLTVQPASITATVGASASFSVSATNPPGIPGALGYQWSRNGSAISDGTNSVLPVSPVKVEKAGSYSVVVTNLYGSVTSSVASLTVTKATPIITALPGFMSATGGTKSESGDFIIHTFTNVESSTFTPTGSGTVEILVVAGGGGGGGSFVGGGGGGGGVLTSSSYAVTAGQEIAVQVGAGGTGSAYNTRGQSGGSSSFGNSVASGGGGGGTIGQNSGLGGGSGGGAGWQGVGGTGVVGQGNTGGTFGTSPENHGGGGGGASGTPDSSGVGGPGIANSISGIIAYYGGGGSAGTDHDVRLAGGLGGGGQGGAGPTNGTDGSANTGGGGGGGGGLSMVPVGGKGGSGIVIVRYKPKILTYGQLSGDAAFSGATASVEGSFAFENPSAAVGTSIQNVIFTPDDTANYDTATRSVSVTVTKANPTITTAPTATPIVYGQTLASSTLSGGEARAGGALVYGTFAFSNPAAAPATGTTSQNVIFTPGASDAANYNTVTIPVNVTVNQALISSGFSHTLYLGAGATTVTAWGLNTDGRLGVGDTNSPVNWAKAVQGIPTNVIISSLAAGGTHSLILANGKVYAAGSDRFGQLGQGGTNRVNRSSFIQVFAPTSRVVAVAAGGNHSLALTELGDVYACGDNTYGQLGNSTLVSSANWIKVSIQYPSTGLSPKIVSVVAGADHNLAVDEDGGVWVWGRNNYGQLGKGTRTKADGTPSELNLGKINDSDEDVVAESVAAGFSHSLILTTDGKVLGFGRNNSGQTGQSATSSVVLVPTLISGLSEIQSISAGTDSSFAINQLGRLYSWGYNSYGELLLGYASPAVYEPVPSPICDNVSVVSGGGYSSLAWGVQGLVFGGRNDVGQAGNGPDPALVVGDYYYTVGSLTLTNLTMDLAGTTETLYDQIFIGKGMSTLSGTTTLNGILNLMFVGTYTGPLYGTTQTFDLIWAKNGIVFGTGYELAFNQAGYLVESAVADKIVEGVSGKVLQATVRAVVTAADLEKEADLAEPNLDGVEGDPYGVASSPGISALSVSPSREVVRMEMIYSYTRPTGGVMSGAEYFFDEGTYLSIYRVKYSSSSPIGPWVNASVTGTTVTPLGKDSLGKDKERVTLRISSSGSAGFLRLEVTEQVKTSQATGISVGVGSATSSAGAGSATSN